MSYLRPYQVEAATAINNCLSNGSRSTLSVLPTGCGKTELGLNIADEWPQGDVLWLAHRQELIYQPADRWRRLTGEDAEIEMGEFRASNTRNRGRLVCASVQTLTREKRIKSLFQDPKRVGLIVVDEAHHSTTPSYTKILEYLDHPDLRILGLTATPDRADEAALGSVYDSVSFEYPLLDPAGGPSAIGDGWLVNIDQEYLVVDELDFSEVASKGGDFVDAQLERVMLLEKSLHKIATPTFELADGKQTLLFTAGIDQAARLTEIFCRHEANCAMALASRIPDDYREVDFMIDSGNKDLRRHYLRRFEQGKFHILSNMGVLTEGYDCPSIRFISVARPTRSRSLYSQLVGRGTRVLPDTIEGWSGNGEFWRLGTADERKAAIAESQKKNLLVADFVGASNHSLICSADILGGRYPDEVVARAKKKLADNGSGNTQELLAESAEEIKREIEARKSIRAKATYERQKRDPLFSLGLVPTREPGWHKGRTPTQKQKAALRKFGIPESTIDDSSFWQATQILDNLISRIDKGLATFKQAKLLQRFGYSGDVSFQEASATIDRIVKNNWRRPD